MALCICASNSDGGLPHPTQSGVVTGGLDVSYATTIAGLSGRSQAVSNAFVIPGARAAHSAGLTVLWGKHHDRSAPPKRPTRPPRNSHKHATLRALGLFAHIHACQIE